MKYYQVFISAANKKQAEKILNILLDKKLVAGGLILNGPFSRRSSDGLVYSF